MTEELKNLCRDIIAGMSGKDCKQREFDSHQIIEYLGSADNSFVLKSALWEELSDKEKSLARQKLHREIGRWMERNQEALGIRYMGIRKSLNYAGDETSNAIWKKL